MNNCRCESCQKKLYWKDISWKNIDSWWVEAFILCPYCKSRLYFSGLAKLIGYPIELAAILMFFSFGRNWWDRSVNLGWGVILDAGISLVAIILSYYVVYVAGRFIEKRLLYAISLLFSLPLVLKSRGQPRMALT